MRRVILLSAVALAAHAQQDDEMTAWMKSMNQSMQAVRKLEKKAGPEVVAAGERLGAIYENMIGFWRQRNAVDAVKISTEGKAAAAVLATAAWGGDEAKVGESLQRIGATCKACHDAHRETIAQGKYRIR